jgi:transposase
MRRHELTDQQWQRIALLLAKNGGRGGQWKECRTILNAMFWRLRTGVPCRDLPERYRPWPTVYDQFTRYREDGTLDRILQMLQRHLHAIGRIEWDLWCVDGSVIRASRAEAGAGQQGALPIACLNPKRTIMWHNGLRLYGFSENALLTCTEG